MVQLSQVAGQSESLQQGEPYHTLRCTDSTPGREAEVVSSPALVPLPEVPKGSVGRGSQSAPRVSNTCLWPFPARQFLSVKPSGFLGSLCSLGPLDQSDTVAWLLLPTCHGLTPLDNQSCRSPISKLQWSTEHSPSVRGVVWHGGGSRLPDSDLRAPSPSSAPHQLCDWAGT